VIEITGKVVKSFYLSLLPGPRRQEVRAAPGLANSPVPVEHWHSARDDLPSSGNSYLG
jgi:hypothetical protein